MVFLFAVAAFVAFGCGRPEVTDEPPRYVEPNEDEPVSQVGQGGTARLALPVAMQPSCLNPYLPECHGAESLGGIVFEGLLSLSPSNEYRGRLAEAVPSYGDGTLSLEPMTIEVRLRPKAAFSDGEPVTSRDVEWTYEQAMKLAEEGRISAAYSGFGHLESVEAEGERTVRLTFDEPYSEWRDLLSAPVLPEHVYGERDFASLHLMDGPVGSGPFLLDEVREDGIGFTASARYWLEELEFPRLDGLELEFEGPGTSAGSLASDRADFGFFSSPGSVPDSGRLLRAEASRTRTELLVFNSTTLDAESRAALAGKLDRRAVAQSAGFGVASRLFPAPLVSSGVGGWSGAEQADGGLPSGTLRLVYPTGGPARDRAVEEVVSQLEAAGTPVEARRVSPGEFFAATLPVGDFDLAVFDVGSLAEYEALAPVLPSGSAAALSASFGAVEDRGQYLARAQRALAEESALAPLYVWPDSQAWSSTLSGPEPKTPYRAVAWNARAWGFYK